VYHILLNRDKNPLSRHYFKCAFETHVENYTMTNAVFYGQGYLFSKPVSAAEFERLFDVPIIE